MCHSNGSLLFKPSGSLIRIHWLHSPQTVAQNSAQLAQSVRNTQFHAKIPFNLKRKVFKHYKYAVGFMTKELDITIKGIAGGSRTSGFRPIYLWDNDIPVLCFKGWENAYYWASNEYEKTTGYKAPVVK